MPPEIAPAVIYGVARVAAVQEFVKAQTAAMRERLEDAITQLQFNPRPPRHATMPVGLPGNLALLQCPVEDTQPKYLLTYMVEDAKEKVTVISIQEYII